MSFASASTTVKFHEFPSGTVVHNYQPGSQIDGPIRSISWSKDGNWLALVPFSGFVEIVGVKDQLKLLYTIQGISEPSCAAFQNTTKKNLAVGTKSGQILVYDIKSKSVKKRFNTATSPVSHVEFTLKDNHIVSACGSGDAFVFSNVANVLSSSFKIPRSQSISALRTNAIKKNYVVAGSNEGVVAVWDINSNKNKFCVGSHKAPVTAVAFSPVTADLVISSGLDRQFCCYDIASGKCVTNIYIEHNITALDFSPDGNYISMASQKGKIYLYDLKNLQTPIQAFTAHNGAIKHLSFRKDEDFETNCGNSSSIFENHTNKDREVLVTPSSEQVPNSESFDLLIEPTDTDCAANRSNSFTSSAPDSFLVDLGLDRNNTAESVYSNKTNNESLKLSENLKKTSLLEVATTPKIIPNILKDKLLQSNSKTHTSTPNFPNISPIVNDNPQVLLHCEGCNLQSGMENLIRNTIKTELKSVTEELKSEMKYYSTYSMDQSRQLCLDLLMSIVVEFIKVENNLNKIENNLNTLRSELLGDFPQAHGTLVEENLMLKQRIAVLQEEVDKLRNDKMNHNNDFVSD